MIAKILSILLISFAVSQSYPVSDPGADIRVEESAQVTLSAAASYAIGDGNSIVNYVWSVNNEIKDKILESNPTLSSVSSDTDGYYDIATSSSTLTFTAPSKESTESYTIYLRVVDSNGVESNEFGAETLIISEYSEANNSSNNRYIEIYNGTGQTITSVEWQDYEVWLSKNGANYEDSDQDFYDKAIFWRDPVEADIDHGLDEDEVWRFDPPDLEDGEALLLIKSAVASSSEQDIREHTHIEWAGLGSMGGNDGIGLVKNSVLVDVIGYGDSPGSSWDVGSEACFDSSDEIVEIYNESDCSLEGYDWSFSESTGATRNNQLVRKANIATGNYRNGISLWDSSKGAEWIVLNPVCSNSDYDNELDCEGRVDEDGNALEECHRVDEGDVELYDIDLDGDGEISESECDNSGYDWDDAEWLSDNFNNAGSHDCTACKNFTTLTVEVFPVAFASLGSSADDFGVVRSESFELAGSGDKDAEYSYDWNLSEGSCFSSGDEIVEIYNESDCLLEGYDWSFYSWLGFCEICSDTSFADKLSCFCGAEAESFATPGFPPAGVDCIENPLNIWGPYSGSDYVNQQECEDLGGLWSPEQTCNEVSRGFVTQNPDGSFLDAAELSYYQSECNNYPRCYWDETLSEQDSNQACKDIFTPIDASSLSVVSPRELVDDTLEICFSLSINDGLLDSSPVIECVTIGNLSPVANAGEDDIYRYSAVLGGSISISAANESYDPNPSDRETLSYQWQGVSGDYSELTLEGLNSENLVISGFPDELETNPIGYSFQLEVTDQGGQISNIDIINIELAEFLPPDPPQLYVVSYSDYVKLSWGFESEQSIDPLTKYADFEGYKLYRSEDGGQTWCPPSDVVYDFDNNAVGCRPLYGMDLTEDQDEKHCMYSNNYESCESVRGEEISGYDPTEPWIYLGDNDGVSHVYYDYGVVQGKEYSYTLTAFDTGLRTYELGYVATGESSEYSGEDFTDCNDDLTICDGDDDWEASMGNGVWDDDESLPDCGLDNNCATVDDDGSQGNGVWDGDILYEQAEIWSSTNPDKWTTAGRLDQLSQLGETAGSLASMENEYGAQGDLNYVEVTVGDLSSNVTDPEIWYEFVEPHPDNVGNGPYSFDIMDRSLAENVILRFEIQADYEPRFAGSDQPANSFESNKTFNPSLYAWEVTKACSDETYSTQIACEENDGDWSGLYGIPVSIGQQVSVDGLSDSEIGYHEDFPGVENDGEFLNYPGYLDGVEGKEIVYFDEDTETNWTDALYGTRFIFNNGYLGFANTTVDGKNTPLIQKFVTHEKEGIFNQDQIIAAGINDEEFGDIGNLYNALTIFENNGFEVYYQNVGDFFDLRPPYEYMIEFSDNPEYKVSSMDNSDVCTDEEEFSRLPFRVKNITTDTWVEMRHTDAGLTDGLGSSELAGADGAKDCFWSRSETVTFKDYVRTYDDPELHLLGSADDEPLYGYDINLDFFLFSFFGSNNNEWQSGVEYAKGDRVYYQSMNWKASSNITGDMPPPTGSSIINGVTTRNGFYDFGEDLKYDEEESGGGLNPNDPNGDNYDAVTNTTGTEQDGFNDNPWEPIYPWEGPHCHDVDGSRLDSYMDQVACEAASQTWFEGDKLYFSPITWYRDGDSWAVDMSEVAFEEEVDGTHFSNVRVVPNPYRAGSTFSDGMLHFEGLPSTCVIKIYTVTGKLIKTINRSGKADGLEEWDIRNDSGDKIAPGLYIYHIKSGSNEYTGKFSIVR